ncbi:MAG: TIGR02391 family protein [Endomicrobiaceae bacterium]|nr:TIGR02391 family protein [Endomicrobiaceae bacterium]
MSNLSSADKKYLDNALRLNSSGGIVHFTDEEFHNFFSEFNIEINDSKYAMYGISKTNKLNAFFEIETNQVVGYVILEFAALFRNRELAFGYLMNIKFSIEIEKIGNKLLGMTNYQTSTQSTTVSITNNLISIEIRPEIYEHIKQLLHNENYFHAVEEAYKVVRNKLRDITGEEQAHRAFEESNYEKIFGHVPKTDVEKDYFVGVKFLHMSLQNFRNEKAHSLASNLDKNLAIHYLSLASLAYDLISRNE